MCSLAHLSFCGQARWGACKARPNGAYVELELLEKLIKACEGLEKSDYGAIFNKVDEIKSRRVSVSLSIQSEPAAPQNQFLKSPLLL